MKITVVTVVLNAGADFALTAESVLAQTHTQVEWVVMDGSSWSEEGRRMLARYQGLADHYASAPDVGVYAAMNEAAKLATGDYIIFLNAGDIFFRADTLANIATELSHKNPDIYYGDHDFVSNEVHHFRKAGNMATIARNLKLGNVGRRWHSRFPCHQATFYRHGLLDDVPFDPRLRIVADHDLLLRAQAGGYDIQSSNLVVCRYYGGGMSARLLDRCKAEWADVYSAYSDHPHDVIRRFLGNDIANQFNDNSTCIVVAGHKLLYGLDHRFADEPIAWVDEGGLKLVLKTDRANPVFALHGHARFDQTISVSHNGRLLEEFTVMEGPFRLMVTFGTPTRIGDVLRIDNTRAEPLSDLDYRPTGWGYFFYAFDQDADAIRLEIEHDAAIDITFGKVSETYSDAVVRLPKTWFPAKANPEVRFRVQMQNGKCMLEIRPDNHPQILLPEGFYLTEDDWGRVIRMMLLEGLAKDPQKYTDMAKDYLSSRELDFATVVVRIIQHWGDIQAAFARHAVEGFPPLPDLDGDASTKPLP